MDHWVGTIRDPELALAWSSLEADGTTRTHWAVCAPFVLVLDDGRTLEVEPTNGDLELGPKSERRGRFRHLADPAMVKRFGGAAPAPHRRALLRTAEARAGDRVTVFGEVVERAFDGESAHREAARSAPSRVRVTRVVLGDPAADDPGPREASRPRPSIQGILAIVGACATALVSVRAFLAGSDQLSPRAPDAGTVALALLGLGLTFLWHVSHPPGFYVGDEPVDPRPPARMLSMAAFLFVFLVTPMVVWDGRTVDHGRLVNNHNEVLGVSGALLAGCLGWILVTGWHTARLSRLILRAPSLERGARDRWGRLVGTVDDPTPVIGEDAAMMVTRELEWDDSGEHEIEMVGDERGGFLLQTPDGETIAVQAHRSTWATNVRRFLRAGLLGPKVPEEGRVWVSSELVPQGAAVVVVGRVRGGERPRLKPSGPESLLLFATAPGGDPVRTLRRVHRRWLALVAALLVAGIATAALHFATVDLLPDGLFFIPDTD